MPIGDLLASISGGESAPPKRKADDDIRQRPAPKVPRRSSPSSVSRPLLAPQQSSRPLDRPNAARPSTSLNGNGLSPNTKLVSSSATSRPLSNGTHRVTKPTAPARPRDRSPPRNGNGNGATAAAAAPVVKAPPKKGSFAEILARGKAAQATMGQVGKIQHKKIDKAPVTKKEAMLSKETKKADQRGGSRADPRSATSSQQSRQPSGYAGTAKPGTRPGGGNTNGSVPGSRKSAGRPGERGQKASATQVEEEKKVKKAASATTGYTGTARPRPGGPTNAKKSNHPPQRGGALLNRQHVRAPASRNSRFDDEYDEDMDDFIDYDDEEEDDGFGKRYTYDDESESDMEAGMDELDLEERRAERIAKQEDIEEERLEKSLKAQKEERKRRALEELRAKRR